MQSECNWNEDVFWGLISPSLWQQPVDDRKRIWKWNVHPFKIVFMTPSVLKLNMFSNKYTILNGPTIYGKKNGLSKGRFFSGHCHYRILSWQLSLFQKATYIILIKCKHMRLDWYFCFFLENWQQNIKHYSCK